MTSNDQERRITTIEFQLGIKQDVQPRHGMRFRRKGGGEWTTIRGTWRMDGRGPTWWVLQYAERDPYLISERLLLGSLQNIKTEIGERTST